MGFFCRARASRRPVAFVELARSQVLSQQLGAGSGHVWLPVEKDQNKAPSPTGRLDLAWFVHVVNWGFSPRDGGVGGAQFHSKSTGRARPLVANGSHVYVLLQLGV